jgi:Tfp pilus assembly PilM family ATPase
VDHAADFDLFARAVKTEKADQLVALPGVSAGRRQVPEEVVGAVGLAGLQDAVLQLEAAAVERTADALERPDLLDRVLAEAASRRQAADRLLTRRSSPPRRC